MEKIKLEELIGKGLSTQGIANEMNLGQTTVRYWLRKFGLNTQFPSRDKAFKDCVNGKKCKWCNSSLTGAQHMYCSPNCKSKYNYSIDNLGNTNTNHSQKERSKNRKLRLIELKGGSCKNCGYCKNYSALCFHHRNPEDKVFCIDSRKLSNTNWDSILIESNKCDLLCANCHSELHNPDKEM